MLSDPSSNADCVEETPRRESAESSDRLPLFCDEKETKRIVEENQCPEYKASETSDSNQVGVTSRDPSSTKRTSTRPGTLTGGTGAALRDAQTRTTLRQRQDDDIDYPKPRKVPSMKATHQARSNKAYDLRYEYTRKGATIPSTMIEHMDNYNKPLFLRFWKGNKKCFEFANDRVQPLIRQEMRRRRSSGIDYRTTKAPRREYRDSYAKRRGATSRSPSDDRRTASEDRRAASEDRRTTMRGGGYSPRDEECRTTTDCRTSPGTGYTTRGGSSPRTRGYATGAGGSPTMSRGSPGGGQTSPVGTGSGCTPFKESTRTQKGARTSPASRATGKGTSPISSKTPKPPRPNSTKMSSKSIYMPMWW